MNALTGDRYLSSTPTFIIEGKMTMITMILLLIAVILFFIAAFGVASNFNLVAAGIGFAGLAFLLPLLGVG